MAALISKGLKLNLAGKQYQHLEGHIFVPNLTVFIIQVIWTAQNTRARSFKVKNLFVERDVSMANIFWLACLSTVFSCCNWKTLLLLQYSIFTLTCRSFRHLYYGIYILGVASPTSSLHRFKRVNLYDFHILTLYIWVPLVFAVIRRDSSDQCQPMHAITFLHCL